MESEVGFHGGRGAKEKEMRSAQPLRLSLEDADWGKGENSQNTPVAYLSVDF